jgi:hypothetical protein
MFIVTAAVSAIQAILSLVALGIGILHIRHMHHLMHNPFLGGYYGGGYGFGGDDMFGGCSGWGDDYGAFGGGFGYGMDPFMFNGYGFFFQFWKCRLFPCVIAIIAISGVLALMYIIAAILGGLKKLGSKGTVGIMATAILLELGCLISAAVVLRRVYRYIPMEFHIFDNRLYTLCILSIIKFVTGLLGGIAAIGVAFKAEKS